MAQLFCALDVVAVEVVLELPLAFAAGAALAPSLSLWIRTLGSMGVTYTGSFEAPFYSQTCAEVPRLLAVKEDPLLAGRRLSRAAVKKDSRLSLAAVKEDRRRLRSRSRSRTARRLKGASGAKAAVAAEADGVAETWTSIGLGGNDELERLPAGTFFGVLLLWACAVACAVVRSMWDQHKKEAVFDGAIHRIKRSVTIAEKSFANALEHLHSADELPAASVDKRALVKSVNLAQRLLERSRRAHTRALAKEVAPEKRAEIALVVPQARPAEATGAEAQSIEVSKVVAKLKEGHGDDDHHESQQHHHESHTGGDHMPVAEVRGMVKGFEGQIMGQMGDVQRILQALLIGQQKSFEREHEQASPTEPRNRRKRRSVLSLPS